MWSRASLWPGLDHKMSRPIMVLLCQRSSIWFSSSGNPLVYPATLVLVTENPTSSELEEPFSSVQSLSRVQLFVTPLTTAHQASLSNTNSQSLPKPMFVESMMPSNHLILCRPLLLLPSVFPSIRVFSNESALHIRWPKDWSFSFNISPSNEHPGLISFRMDWLDLLAVQQTLKSLLQHHSSKASILRHSAFFTVQLSHPEPLGLWFHNTCVCHIVQAA